MNFPEPKKKTAWIHELVSDPTVTQRRNYHCKGQCTCSIQRLVQTNLFRPLLPSPYPSTRNAERRSSGHLTNGQRSACNPLDVRSLLSGPCYCWCLIGSVIDPGVNDRAYQSDGGALSAFSFMVLYVHRNLFVDQRNKSLYILLILPLHH